VESEKIGFEYPDGPVVPKPEKLPAARKRKSKSGSGDQGGSDSPPKGPPVKV
jgi:ATP-dependent Clp protease ATP-binding subunit ClpA